jgi:DNA-directed RNA polymerase subunit F
MDRAEPKKRRVQKEEAAAPRVGRGGRLQMLVYMWPKNIDEMKDFAIYERRPVSTIVEELVEAFISRRRKTTKSKAMPVARGGRRQVLVYMSRENIRELKRIAIADGRPAYIIIEELVEAWLKKRRKQKD